MRLNEHSAVHVRIRKCCQQIELLANMKLVTDLSQEYDQIRFVNKLGYIHIDYRNETCFTLGIHLNDLELQIVKDIMLFNNWLETGEKIQNKIHK